MRWKTWVKDTFVRAIETMLEAAAGLLVIDLTNLVDVDWWAYLTAIIVAGIGCMIVSLRRLIKGKRKGNKNEQKHVAVDNELKRNHARKLP